MKQGIIFVVSAPSGAGKTTLLHALRNHIPQLHYSISATTRKPRKGEIDGEHYFFLTQEQFEQKIAEGAFIEYENVHGNWYATPRGPIEEKLEAGINVVMDIDVKGKKKFDAFFPQAIGILILPPSDEVLKKRLEDRGTETPDVVQMRLKNAKREIALATTVGKYEHTIINDSLQRAQKELIELIQGYIAAK